MNTTRRTFIGGAIAFAPFSALWAEEEKPLAKIGLMTDTHVGKTKESCARARLAYELFRDIGVDMIVNDGDVADHHYPTGYVAYREMVEETFAGVPADRRPQELFVYAWHDTYEYKGHPREASKGDAKEAFADMQRLIKSPNGPYAEGEIKGYRYVVIPQFYENGTVDWARFDRMLTAAERASDGKPVFVFAHVPPAGTTRSGRGDQAKRKVLNRHPQVINISGHTHGSMREERAIWQGEFTSMNAGCLQNWGGGLPGSAPMRMQNYGAVLMEVFANRIVFRRFDVRDRKEYSADAPWVVPWPFDPATAPYRRELRAAAAKTPEFASDAKISVALDKPFKTAKIEFPCVSGAVRPLAYRIEIEMRGGNGGWIPFARRDVYGDFWQREAERPASVSQAVSAAYFTAGTQYRVSVRPRNVWGREGRELSCTFTAESPAADGTTVWESSNPMKDCMFLKGLAGKTELDVKNGFFEMPSGAQYRLALPKEAWTGDKGAKFRFTVDMTTEQGEEPCWTFVLRNRKPLNNAVARIATPPGKSGSMRYVLEFAKKGADYTYDLLVREGGAGRIRFDYVKIERM